MSSENERPKLVIWVPDMSRETGWSGYFVNRDDRVDPRQPRKSIGFKQKHVRAEVE